jgi:DNA polymerase I-like protein with 3'-5' exonuclease and polymerase domains
LSVDWATQDKDKLQEMLLYCARDSAQTVHLFEGFDAKALPHERLLYADLKELYEIGLRMEARGIWWGEEEAKEHRIALRRAAFKALRDIVRGARKLRWPRGSFNPNAAACLVKFFTGKPPKEDDTTSPIQFGLEVVDRTPSGAPKMDKESLEYYAACANAPAAAAMARAIMRYRRLTKQLSTYVDGLQNKTTLYVDVDGKVTGTPGKTYRLLHVQQLCWVPVTGRWSTKPNDQNIPSREDAEIGTRNLRNMIKARPGYVLVGADEAALEGRIVALQAGVPELIADFLDDVDVHLKNAERLFKCKLSKKSPERQAIKTTFYAFLYGAKDETIWRRLVLEFPEITLRQVCIMTAFLRKTYPEIPAWWEWSKRVAAERDYAEEPLSGRRFKFFGAVDPNSAINFPVQSWGATMLNRAVLAIARELEQRPEWDTHILIQCHDELVLECPNTEEAITRTKALLLQYMQQTHKHLGREMVFTIETKHGPSWAECH